MYRTQIQKIQIFLKMKKYSENPGYNKYMDIPTFNKMMDSENLAVKIFSETCCNGCTCQSSKDHLTEEEFFLEEIDLDK